MSGQLPSPNDAAAAGGSDGRTRATYRHRPIAHVDTRDQQVSHQSQNMFWQRCYVCNRIVYKNQVNAQIRAKHISVVDQAGEIINPDLRTNNSMR